MFGSDEGSVVMLRAVEREVRLQRSLAEREPALTGIDLNYVPFKWWSTCGYHEYNRVAGTLQNSGVSEKPMEERSGHRTSVLKKFPNHAYVCPRTTVKSPI